MKSLKMAWINCQLLFGIIVLSLLGTANDDNGAGSNNIIFTIKETQSYVPVVILLAKD